MSIPERATELDKASKLALEYLQTITDKPEQAFVVKNFIEWCVVELDKLLSKSQAKGEK